MSLHSDLEIALCLSVPLQGLIHIGSARIDQSRPRRNVRYSDPQEIVVLLKPIVGKRGQSGQKFTLLQTLQRGQIFPGEVENLGKTLRRG